MKYFRCGRFKLELGKKTYVMGILNMTPDSFSDGGIHNSIDTALEWAFRMVGEGADIIDIGGESTRPGHQPVKAEEEIGRVVPVIELLSKKINVPISIDTSKAQVAEAALKAGASIVNDIWGLQSDPRIADVAARYEAGIVMMHNKSDTVYEELMTDIVKFLYKSVEIASAAGVPREFLAIDPGIGFGKTLEQNLETMRRLKELKVLGLPVLLGTSRKSMIGSVLDLPVDERLEGTAATVSLGIAYGVDIIRVHDVKEMVRAARMSDAIVRNIS